MNKLLNTLIIILYIISISTVVLAQPGDPALGDPDNAVPIPGIIYLIAGGLILGLKKIIGNQKKLQ